MNKMYNYAGLSVRIKALFADAFFLCVMMFVFSAIFESMEDVPDTYRKAAFISLFIVYEPLMVSLFGATIGQFICKLRVRKESNHAKKINILAAVLRFAVKAFLGVFSLFTISTSERSRAIHDSASMSVVLDLNEPLKPNSIEKDTDQKEFDNDELLDAKV